MKFEGKVVFITGGASGIGLHCARSFAREGAQVALADKSEVAGVDACEALKHEGYEADFYHLDVSEYTQVKAVVSSVIGDYGKIDIAVNNAGVGGAHPARTADHTIEDWDRVIAVNQSGVFYCMKEELTHMQTRNKGAIVNISSIAGLKGLPRHLAYTASKHAVVGMTRTAALEYAKKGIRVNAVCPVFTNSPMLEELFSFRDDLKAKLIQTIPMGRYGEVGDIVNAIMWLCQDESTFITGLCIPVDGGQTA